MNARRQLSLLIAVSSLLLLGTASSAAVLSVGADKQYKLPSQAADAAKDGDTIEIDPGTYSEDCAIWRRDGLTIRGKGERPVIDSKGQAAEEKGVWVVKGDNTLIENVELTGCAVKDRNGAGIRQEGRNLTLRNCLIHDNENGIFASDNVQSDIKIEFCEFAHNGYGNGQSHNIYINYLHNFQLRGCYVHNPRNGDNVKTRAQANFILYNRIADDDDSTAALPLNFPNGGACYVVGNIVRKGVHTRDPAFVSLGSEGAKNTKQSLYLINNTFANAKKSLAINNVRRGASLFRTQGGTALRVMDNVLLNVSKNFESSGSLEMVQIKCNLFAAPGDFVDAQGQDFHLNPRSDARKGGTSPGFADGIDLTPRFEYVTNCAVKPRASGSRDIGAFEAN